MNDQSDQSLPVAQFAVVGPIEHVVSEPGDPQGEATDGGPGEGDSQEVVESIEQPAKVIRIGAMIKQLLEEARQAPLDQASRQRLREIYERSVREVATGLSPDLQAELDRLALPFESNEPSEAELRIAQAQLLGWLEGLFHGIQAALFAQQMAAHSQLEEMRARGLPMRDGVGASPGPASPGGAGRVGPYL